MTAYPDGRKAKWWATPTAFYSIIPLVVTAGAELFDLPLAIFDMQVIDTARRKS